MSAAWAIPLAVLCWSASAAAQTEEPGILMHVPPPRLTTGDDDYPITARFQGKWTGTALELCLRPAGASQYSVTPFLADDGNGLIAHISPSLVSPPGIEYYIRSVEADGTGRIRFAGPEAPHFLAVDPSRSLLYREARKARHGNRPTEFMASFQRFDLGETRQLPEQTLEKTELGLLQDSYNQLEVGVRYAFLQSAIYHISFGYGMLGGVLGTQSPDMAAYEAPNASKLVLEEGRPIRPGLYYGFGTAYWEIFDVVGLEAKVTMGASYRGFEAGGGALARLGTLRGTNFAVGFEGVTHVGYRFTTEFQWSTLPHFRMSLKNEVTTYPFGEETAVIPSYNISLLLDFLEINGTLGYGVRKGYEHGGFCGGGGLTLRL